MRLALVVCALAATSLAHANPPAKPTAPAVLVEVRWHSDGLRVVSKLFSTGMWTRTFTEYGSRTSTTGGRLDSATFEEVKAGLAAARWKVTKAKARCQEASDEATEFYVAGHKRFTAATCGDTGNDHIDTIDARTQKLIDLLGEQLELVERVESDEEISVVTP